MNINGNEITISLARYEELIVAEHEAQRLKEIIASRANEFTGFNYSEVRTLRDLFFPEAKEEEE